MNRPLPRFFFAVPVGGMKNLSEVERAAWLARNLGALMNMRDQLGFSVEGDWYRNNLRNLGEVARGEHDDKYQPGAGDA